MLQNTAATFGGLVACRLFLGAFEGLFGTGIMYYLSLWYKRTELGEKLFWYLGPTAIAGAFGGLIAFGIGHAKDPALKWRYLFLVSNHLFGPFPLADICRSKLFRGLH